MATNRGHWLKVQSRWFKNYIFGKKCIFISFWIFKYYFYYSFTLYYCAIFYSLDAGFFQYLLGVLTQIVWIQIRPDILSGPIWVQTVCKGYRKTTKKSPIASKELNTKQLVDIYYFLAKTFHLAPTFSNWLMCWLQQILSQGKL